MSSQIWCFLKFPLCWGGGGVPKIKVDQNGMKHGLVLEFLRSDEIFKMEGGSKNQSCSEWRETWSRFGIFEIR